MNSTYTRRYYAAFTATINFSTSLYFTSAVVTVLSSQMSVSSSAYRTDCNQPSTSITIQSLPSAAACRLSVTLPLPYTPTLHLGVRAAAVYCKCLDTSVSSK